MEDSSPRPSTDIDEPGSKRLYENVGLVLSGGGGKGAYEIGCWSALRELGVTIDAVVGTSVGALNAALIAQGDLQGARDLWADITAKDVFKLTRHRLPALLLRLLLLPGLLYYRGSTSARLTVHRRFLAAALFTFLVVGVPAIAISLGTGYRDWSDLRALVVFYACAALAVGIPVGGWFWMEKRNLFVLDNRPLEKTIAGSLDSNAVSDSEIDAFVTAARAVDFFDPDEPSFEAAEAGGTYYYFPCTAREYLPVYSRLNGRARDDIGQLLLGSTSLPFGIFANRALNDAGWLDGGLADNTPVLPLIELGCDPIIVVHLDHRVGKSRDAARIDEMVGAKVAALERKLEIEADSAENLREFIGRYGSMVELTHWPDSSGEEHFKPRRPLPRLVHIVPSRRLGGLLRGTLRFSPRRARWLMELGYEDAKRSLLGRGLEPLSPRRAAAARLGKAALVAVAVALGLLGLVVMADGISNSKSVHRTTEIPVLMGIGTALIVGGSCLLWYSLLRRSTSCAPAGVGVIAWLVGLLVAIHGMEGLTLALVIFDSLIALLLIVALGVALWSSFRSRRST